MKCELCGNNKRKPTEYKATQSAGDTIYLCNISDIEVNNQPDTCYWNWTYYGARP